MYRARRVVERRWLRWVKCVQCLGLALFNAKLVKLRVNHGRGELSGHRVIQSTRARGRHLESAKTLHVLHDPGVDTRRREVKLRRRQRRIRRDAWLRAGSGVLGRRR